MDELLDLIFNNPALLLAVEEDLARPAAERRIVRPRDTNALHETPGIQKLGQAAEAIRNSPVGRIAGRINQARERLNDRIPTPEGWTEPASATEPLNLFSGLVERYAPKGRQGTESLRRMAGLADAVIGTGQPGEILEGPAAAAVGPLVRGAREGAERIAAAAIQSPEGKIFRGEMHADARHAARKLLGEDARWQGTPSDWSAGFVTDQGRFVSREEALQIARAARQARVPASTGEKLASDYIEDPKYFKDPSDAYDPAYDEYLDDRQRAALQESQPVRLADTAPDLGPVANARREEMYRQLGAYTQRPDNSAPASDFGTAQFLTKQDGMNENFSRRVADEYERAESKPDDPEVQAAYRQFAGELEEQYRFVTEDLGIKMVVTEDDPYKNSTEMAKDVLENGQMRVFKSNDGDHPLLSGEENTKFRFIHDALGHAIFGNTFGPRGEENAFRAHAEIFSPSARRALATETRGQNSWVNYGPLGRANRADPANTRFADQKVFLLPEEMTAPTPRGPLVDEPLPARPDPDEVIRQTHEEFGGSTIDPRTGQSMAGTDQWAVATPTQKLFDTAPSEEDIAKFRREHADELKDPNKFIGTWNDTKGREAHGKHELNITEVYPTQAEAEKVGRGRGEVAILHLDPGFTFPQVNLTYGKDEILALPETAPVRAALERWGPRLEGVPNVVTPGDTWGKRAGWNIFDRKVPDNQGTRASHPDLVPSVGPRMGLSPLVEAITNSRTVLKGLNRDVDRGLLMGGPEWYNTAPVDAFLLETPGALTPDEFHLLGAASSASNSVPNEFSAASLVNWARKRGIDMSTEEGLKEAQRQFLQMTGWKNKPSVMGMHYTGGLNALQRGVYLPSKLDSSSWKIPSYADKRMGGGGILDVEAPGGMAALDTHERRRIMQLVMENPKLAKLARQKSPRAKMSPAEAAAKDSGRLPLGNALDYQAIARMYNQGAHQYGILPGQYQASRWQGGGHLTGLETDPKGDFTHLLEKSIYDSARLRGFGTTPRELREYFARVARGDDLLLPLGY